MFEDLATWWNSVIFGPDAAVAQDTAHAMGFDPASGTFVSPQVADTFAKMHPGVDPSTFVANAQQVAIAQNDTTEASNFNFLGGYSILPFAPVNGGDAQAIKNITAPFSGLAQLLGVGDGSGIGDFVPIALIFVVGFLLIKAVK